MSRSLGLPSPQQINTPAQLSVFCKLGKSALNPLLHTIEKDLKQAWPQHRALESTSRAWLPTGCSTIPTTQAGFYPVRWIPIPSMCRLFLQENALGDRVKCLTKAQADTSSAFPSSTRQVRRQDNRLIKQDLSVPTPHWLGLTPWLSHMCWVMSLLHNIAQHQGQGQQCSFPLVHLSDTSPHRTRVKLSPQARKRDEFPAS